MQTPVTNDRPVRATSRSARVNTCTAYGSCDTHSATTPATPTATYAWPDVNALSRGGHKSGIYALEHGTPGLLPNPMHVMDECEYKGGAWPRDLPFAKRCMHALARIGKSLPSRYKYMPDYADLRARWDEYKVHACAYYGMSDDDVHHAMLVMFPLHYDAQCAERDNHLADSPCMDMGVDGPVRCENIYPRRYYQVHLGRRRMMSLHRLVLFLMAGPPLGCDDDASIEQGPSPHTYDAAREMIDSMHAIHLCDNKRCVNWLHITWGSARYNNDMRVRKQWMAAHRYRDFRLKCMSNRNDRLAGRRKDMPEWPVHLQPLSHTS